MRRCGRRSGPFLGTPAGAVRRRFRFGTFGGERALARRRAGARSSRGSTGTGGGEEGKKERGLTRKGARAGAVGYVEGNARRWPWD